MMNASVLIKELVITLQDFAKCVDPVVIIWLLAIAVEFLASSLAVRKSGKCIGQEMKIYLWKKVGMLFIVIVAVMINKCVWVAHTEFPKIYALWPRNLPKIVALFYTFKMLIHTLELAVEFSGYCLPWIKKLIDILNDIVDDIKKLIDILNDIVDDMSP